jgi:hypothetical protein
MLMLVPLVRTMCPSPLLPGDRVPKSQEYSTLTDGYLFMYALAPDRRVASDPRVRSMARAHRAPGHSALINGDPSADTRAARATHTTCELARVLACVHTASRSGAVRRCDLLPTGLDDDRVPAHVLAHVHVDARRVFGKQSVSLPI